MCLVRAPLDESTEAHIVHFWGWRDPGFCWLGLLLPFVDFLTGTSSDEDDVWSTSLSWISSSASLSLKTTFSWRSSLSNRIWPDKVFILRRVSIKIVSPAERSVLLPVPPQSASLSVEITPHTYILAGDWVYLMIDCSKWQGWLKVHYNMRILIFKYEKIELLVCIYEISGELVFIYGISGWSSPFGSVHVLQQENNQTNVLIKYFR